MKIIKSICVFCGSSESVDDNYKAVATELGRAIGKKGVDFVYGGASIGLMGCVARGVHEEKGKVIGILPKIFHTIRAALPPLEDAYSQYLGAALDHSKHHKVFHLPVISNHPLIRRT